MNNIPWKNFTTEKDGIRLEVTWWDHDFNAKYKVGDIVLKYSRHIMAMCPMKYTEEWLKADFEKNGLYASFKEAGEIISNQTVLFEAIKAQFAITKKESLEHQKDYYNICSDIAKDISVINQETRSLITDYLLDLWRDA